MSGFPDIHQSGGQAPFFKQIAYGVEFIWDKKYQITMMNT